MSHLAPPLTLSFASQALPGVLRAERQAGENISLENLEKNENISLENLEKMRTSAWKTWKHQPGKPETQLHLTQILTIGATSID